MGMLNEKRGRRRLMPLYNGGGGGPSHCAIHALTHAGTSYCNLARPVCRAQLVERILVGPRRNSLENAVLMGKAAPETYVDFSS